ncbi:septal ring lytic transglycosylase RlpA family protein [Methylobacterium trifolii]|uniref:Endolytic peptidoglycan transglycosylase RlpA n=1 Tax=Methylobacterium trifolii TaxID=1003092 RepID=A0ABQ4U3G4_9HYPH|nr:septal ring lytic transglycosylase RlpA family protein [Methylobacterium trifolii]GJE60365.1 Endolytic peptidoglycan transglycosylase RlpA [Methylobacterium trifolii]
MTSKPVFRKAATVLATAASLSAASLPAAAQSGGASWYGSGHRTASGERFNPNGMTAAHRSLPFGTRVRVENKRTGRAVVVRINDRGPFVRGRIIDLSRGSARALGMGGTSYVSLQVLN